MGQPPRQYLDENKFLSMPIVANLGAMVVVNGSLIPSRLGIYKRCAVGHDLQQRSRFRTHIHSSQTCTKASTKATPCFVDCDFLISIGLVDVDKFGEVGTSQDRKEEEGVLKRKSALGVKLASFSSKSSLETKESNMFAR